VVCALLLLWIFHSIFLNEAKSAWPGGETVWDALSPAEQRQAAWTDGPSALWHTLSLVRPVWFALSLVFMGLTILIGVIRWRMVLSVHGLRLTFGRTAEISLVAHFFNSFLLGSTGGDLLKAYYAARETHHKKPEAVVTVLVDRLIGLFSMLLFAVLMMGVNLHLVSTHASLAATGWFVILMFLACGTVIALSFWGGVSRTVPRFRHWLRKLPKGEMVERAIDACRIFGRDRGFLLRTTALSMLLNAVCVGQLWALSQGLNLDVPIKSLLVVVPIVICISALPITPSGLGVRENLYVLLLADVAIGVPATSALSLSLLAYAGSLCWSLLGGLVYLSLKDAHHLKEVTASDPPG